MKKNTIIVIVVILVLIIGVAIWWLMSQHMSGPVACTQDAKICPDGSSVGRTGPDCTFAACPTPPAKISGWKTYTDAENGILFQYPPTFNTKYAQFQENPTAIVSLAGSKNIDKGGCYIPANPDQINETKVTINNMAFCLTTDASPGAGQLYNSYFYTTLKNGKYVTLSYVVHTLNGCDPYMGTPDYQPCTDFMKNYNTIVVSLIQQSVATLTVSATQDTCNTNADCPAGYSCLATGPMIISDQPVAKTCVAPGQAVPL